MSIYLFGNADVFISVILHKLCSYPGFQVGGDHLKKLRRAEGGPKFFWVFRVKNHDFTPPARSAPDIY